MSHVLAVWLDRVGVMASCVCAFHCLALPFLVVALQILELHAFVSEAGERFVIFGSVAIAAVSLIPAYLRLHRKSLTMILSFSGLGLILITHFFLEEILVLRILFVLLGATLLASGHLLNIKYCRECRSC